eukprot:10026113-Lingulodinium_polyedra.AAC.1
MAPKRAGRFYPVLGEVVAAVCVDRSVGRSSLWPSSARWWFWFSMARARAGRPCSMWPAISPSWIWGVGCHHRQPP